MLGLRLDLVSLVPIYRLLLCAVNFTRPFYLFVTKCFVHKTLLPRLVTKMAEQYISQVSTIKALV